MSLRSLFLTFGVIFIAWWWLRSREQKELAIAAATQRCSALSLTLLDHTVVQSKLRLQRDHAGRMRVLRRYLFDFTSTGEDRYQGTIDMRGRQVISIDLPPHRVQ